MSKYEIYIDKINTTKNIEELKQITNEIENNFSGIEKSSLINKIESKKSEVNTNNNEVKSDVTSKSNDTISINKSTLKKAGIIGLFAGVAILSSVVTTKLNKGNDYNTANNIPTQTVADVPTYTDSTISTETSTNIATGDDSFLNNYNITAEEWQEYMQLSEEDKEIFRVANTKYPSVVQFTVEYDYKEVKFSDGMYMIVTFSKIAESCRENGYEYIAVRSMSVTKSNELK